MKYKVLGQNITNVYEVKDNKNEKGEYVRKPEFVKNRKYEWEDILAFECDNLEFNTAYGVLERHHQICISETKSVDIIRQRFRADEATTYLYSDEVLSEEDDKETNHQQYVDEVNKYIKLVFKKYPEVKNHCEIYNISDENVFENIDKIKDEIIKKRGGIKNNVSFGTCSVREDLANEIISATLSSFGY